MKSTDLCLKTPKSFDDMANKINLLLWQGLQDGDFLTQDLHDFPTMTKLIAQTLRQQINTCPNSMTRSWDDWARTGSGPFSQEAIRRARANPTLDLSNLLATLENTALMYTAPLQSSSSKKKDLCEKIHAIFRDRVKPYLADNLYYAEIETPLSTIPASLDKKPRTRLTISTAHTREKPRSSIQSSA